LDISERVRRPEEPWQETSLRAGFGRDSFKMIALGKREKTASNSGKN
jgi:hypothetical protein